MDDMKEIRETAEKVLRNAMVAALARTRAPEMTEDERADLLRPLEETANAHMRMLNECLTMASLAGANSVHQTLHRTAGMDPELLDAAVEEGPKTLVTPDEDLPSE